MEIKSKKNVVTILISILISIILYILWIQISVGNIWWRNNSFQPQQILTFFERPFNKYGYMWHTTLLDTNPYIFIPIIAVIIYIIIRLI